MSKHLSLIVPLLKYSDAPQAARSLVITYQGLDDCVWQLLGHAPTAQLPLAALGYQTEIQSIEHEWVMRADPVHLRLDRQAAYLLDAAFIGIQAHETEALIASINQYQDDFIIEATHPERWYIRQSQAIDLQALRLEQIRGANVSTAMPTGKDALHWQQIGNEIQMLFFDHPVNQTRRERGQAEINSLWFWGAGQLPAPASSPWQQVFSQQFSLNAIAKQQGIDCQNPPKNAQALLKALPEGDSLVYLDLCADEQLDTWQQDWLTPLERALAQGQLEQVHLYAEEKAFSLEKPSWWQRLKAAL